MDRVADARAAVPLVVAELRRNFSHFGKVANLNKILQPPCNGLPRNTQAGRYRLLVVGGTSGERVDGAGTGQRRAHPARDPAQSPPGRHTLGRPHRGAEGNGFEGAALACSWVLAETGNFFLDHCYDDGSYDGFADPWEDDIVAEGTEEWRKAPFEPWGNDAGPVL